MTKTNKVDLFHTIIMLFIFLWLFHSLGKFEDLFLTHAYGYEAIKEDSIYFRVEDTEKLNLSQLLEGNIIRNATLMKHTKNTTLDYEVIYTQGSKDIFGGQYFEGQDFHNKENLAIIGSNIKAKIGSNDFFYRNHISYKVIGILTFSKVAPLNESIFYTNGDISNIFCDDLFVIASSEKQNIEDSLQHLKSYFKEKDIRIKIIDIRATVLDDFIEQNTSAKVLLFLILFFLFVMILINLIFWLYKNQEECKVYFIFGLKFYWIKITRKIIACYSFAFFAGTLLNIAFVNKIDFLVYAVLYFIIFLIMLIVIWSYKFWYLYKLRKGYYVKNSK